MKLQPEFLPTSAASLVKVSGGDDDVALAAWVSFNRDSEFRLKDRDRVEGLINFLMREGHTSPFEHVTFTFKIDTPIFVAREFMRHRTMSYNEVSGRYTEMMPRFYVPHLGRPVVQEGKAGKYSFSMGTWIQRKIAQRVLMAYSKASYRAYEYLLSKGIAKEVARMLLPLNLMTQFYATVNAHNLMKFLNLRNSEQALYEIRELAREMEYHLYEAMPFTYKAWKRHR